MLRKIIMSVILLTLMSSISSAAGKGVNSVKDSHVLNLAFDKAKWEFSSQGKYLPVRDPRGLFQVFHPWDISSEGDFGAISTRIEIPNGWSRPIFLNLYVNDTYMADGWEKAKPDHLKITFAACQQFVGHRFKQVLIDEKLVWEQDVGDAESFDYTSIDITKFVKPGKSYNLTLRIIDKVGSAVKLPGDEFKLGIWNWHAEKDKDADKKFYTRVFWGDVALSSGAALDWEKNPARVETPLKPVKTTIARAATHAEGIFTLNAPDGLPEDGYPVTWGIPFAQGKLLDKSLVALADSDGKPIPLQTQILHKWPDGSIHWLLLDFQAGATNACKSLTLSYGSEVSKTPDQTALNVTETAGEVTVNTGAFSFSVIKGAGVLARSFALAGEPRPLAEKIVGLVKTRDGWEHTDFTPVNESVVVEASGPERATIAISGKLTAEKEVFGRFTCRINAYRGKSYVRILYRIFNDTNIPAQLVTDFSLHVQTPMKNGEAIIGEEVLPTGAAETERLFVRQTKCDSYTILTGADEKKASGSQWIGPIGLRTSESGVFGAVRHFAQLYPKRMWAGEGGKIVFDLFTPTIDCEQYVITRGEAKRHEILLYLHQGDDKSVAQSVFKAFETPPILISAEWYAENGAFGRGAAITRDDLADVRKYMTIYAPSLACYQPQGIRNWPDTYSDSVYSAYRNIWGNMYQEVDYGAYIVGLLGGRREWIDYARAYQEHFMDIDICHYTHDKAFIGASYGISAYHTGFQPYALNAPLGGLFILYYLTGDPDARESAVGIADWIYNANQGLGASSGRAVGWPLRSSMIAYENTGDKKHLEAGKRLAEFSLAEAVPRRGFFSEGSTAWQYRGGSSTMNSILMGGLMRYWRASGDERIGRLCADISFNMAYSWMSPTEPGLVLNLDPLQQLYTTGYAMQDILALFWGYELTGDKTFLEKGAQVMRASILDEKWQGAAFGLSRYWEMQDILYYYAMAKKEDSKP